MITAVDRAGPHRPEPTTPLRWPGSVRRTSSIDSTRPDGLMGDVRVDGRARELLTRDDGSTAVLATQDIAVVTDTERTIRTISVSPGPVGIDALVGQSIATGFRARLAGGFPVEGAHRSLANLLLDDLPGATLVSGYALQQADLVGIRGDNPEMRAGVLGMADVCAGWAEDASIIVTFLDRHEIPSPVGPPAPRLERGDDPLGWHDMADLPAHATRRRRRLDLRRAEERSRVDFDAHFRDSYVDPDLRETVVHEYTVTGSLDVASRRFLSVVADARVLPWVECPAAVASATRLVGLDLEEIGLRVRREFTGTSTCTHLNDMLRTLADLGPMVDHLG